MLVDRCRLTLWHNASCDWRFQLCERQVDVFLWWFKEFHIFIERNLGFYSWLLVDCKESFVLNLV